MPSSSSSMPVSVLAPLCVFGFFVNLRPLEPFLTTYLMGPQHNLSAEEVVNSIYPVWTYSYLALLLPVFLATDFLRYKPLLLLQAASLMLTYVLLWKARGVLAMQALEFFFGVATATEVAYYSYVYSVVDPAHYQRGSAYCRSAALFGSAAGSLSGQIMLTVASAPLVALNLATLAAAAVAFIAPWFLPMPRRSLFFHRHGNQDDGHSDGHANGHATHTLQRDAAETKTEDGEDKGLIDHDSPRPPEEEGQSIAVATVLRLLLDDFLRCYRQRALLAWSLWWALATCGYFQIVNYAQPLWEELRPLEEHRVYNGYTETLATMLGALAALLAGVLPVRWTRWGELALFGLSLLMAGCVVAMVTTGNIWICYGCYVLFRATYNLLITMATFQIAASLTVQRYALVFGVNTFIALLLQTLLTLVVVDNAGLGLDVSAQFLVYAGYFFVVSVVFLLAGLWRLTIRGRHNPGAGLPEGEAETPPPPADAAPVTE